MIVAQSWYSDFQGARPSLPPLIPLDNALDQGVSSEVLREGWEFQHMEHLLRKVGKKFPEYWRYRGCFQSRGQSQGLEVDAGGSCRRGWPATDAVRCRSGCCSSLTSGKTFLFAPTAVAYVEIQSNAERNAH